MNAFAKILLLLVSLLSLANMAMPVHGTQEDQLNRVRRGLMQSAGGGKRRAVTKSHKTLAICVG